MSFKQESARRHGKPRVWGEKVSLAESKDLDLLLLRRNSISEDMELHDILGLHICLKSSLRKAPTGCIPSPRAICPSEKSMDVAINSMFLGCA
jgi:hypothetical protein